MTDFVPGLNDPSPVSRVIVFGYYDGATDGVMELADGLVYRFDLADETHNPEGCDERQFDLRPLPPGSLDRLAAIIGEHITPAWPVWAPIWNFSTDVLKVEVERRVDAILDLASEPQWRITTSDTTSFGMLTALPLRSAVRAG